MLTSNMTCPKKQICYSSIKSCSRMLLKFGWISQEPKKVCPKTDNDNKISVNCIYKESKYMKNMLTTKRIALPGRTPITTTQS